jgi:uncharacterized membrane protein YgcG
MQLLGDVGHFDAKDQSRINRSGRDLAAETGLPVCVAFADTTGRLMGLVAQCPKGILLAFALDKKDVKLTVQSGTPLAAKLTPDISKSLLNGDILYLLRKGKGADGVVNGLEGLILISRGKYQTPIPGWVSWTWPLILLATFLVLWLIARQSDGKGRGAGILIDGEGFQSDLKFPKPAAFAGGNAVPKVLHGRW